jgi:L-iditol 2-dehydrogenase
MRTVELVARRTLEVFDRPLPPDPGPGEVMVKLRAVGICGSDLHWYQDYRIGHTPVTAPLILGHEPVGEVVAIGRGVTSHRLGDKVAVEPSIVCGQCEFCRSGRPNNCVKCVFMGGPQHPGFFREFATVPARNAEHFPEQFTHLQAVLIEPVAVIAHILELTPVPIGATIVVIGAGPIGLLMALMSKLQGASHVVIADRVPHRLRIARQMGIEGAVDTAKEDLATYVKDLTAGRGADIVFDAAAGAGTTDLGFHAARPGGQYVLIGIPSDISLPVDIHTAMNKELSIQTIKRSNHKGHEAIEWIASGNIPDLMITHVMGIEQTPEAFELVSNYRDGVGKLVIELGM